MYKSGTSWLLAALAAHPEILGVREIDILKAVGEHVKGEYRLKPVKERINHVFGGSAWCGIQLDLHAEGAIREFMSEEECRNAGAAQSLYQLQPDLAITVLGRLLNEKRKRKFGSEYPDSDSNAEFPAVKFGESKNEQKDEPVSCISSSPDALKRMFEQVRDAEDPVSAANSFTRGVEETISNEKLIVYKAADMLARMPLLNSWQPGIRKIIIVRDGRDASISAAHYRDLMDEQKMPWTRKRNSVRDVKRVSAGNSVQRYLKLLFAFREPGESELFSFPR